MASATMKRTVWLPAANVTMGWSLHWFVEPDTTLAANVGKTIGRGGSTAFT